MEMIPASTLAYPVTATCSVPEHSEAVIFHRSRTEHSAGEACDTPKYTYSTLPGAVRRSLRHTAVIAKVCVAPSISNLCACSAVRTVSRDDEAQ